MKIRTYRLPETRTRGVRVRAASGGRSVTVPWDYALEAEEMHAYAARVLAQRVTESYSAPEVRKVRTCSDGYTFMTN